MFKRKNISTKFHSSSLLPFPEHCQHLILDLDPGYLPFSFLAKAVLLASEGMLGCLFQRKFKLGICTFVQELYFGVDVNFHYPL